MKYCDSILLLSSTKKFNICLGLERVQKILALFNNPQDKLNIIHIAGTNGKGSVCAICSSILRESGYKTGLFTSPHLINYTERIKINDNEISKKDFSKYIQNINNIALKEGIELTEFELLTVLAFVYFYDKKVDIVVLETGLGGRLDATNIVKKPLICAITSISKDHTERLGDTIEKIAFEKGGIIKKDCPIVISDKNLGFNTIKEIAKIKNSDLLVPKQRIKIEYKNEKNYAIFEKKRYIFSLFGQFQAENLQISLKIMQFLSKNYTKIDKNSIKNGLKNVKWKARLEYNPQNNILIDGCHNPDGARVLRESLDFYFPNKKITFIYGTLKNKDYKKIMETLFKKEDTTFFYNFKHKNSLFFEKNITLSNLKKLLAAQQPDRVFVLCGSLYMIGELLSNMKQLSK